MAAAKPERAAMRAVRGPRVLRALRGRRESRERPARAWRAWRERRAPPEPAVMPAEPQALQVRLAAQAKAAAQGPRRQLARAALPERREWPAPRAPEEEAAPQVAAAVRASVARAALRGAPQARVAAAWEDAAAESAVGVGFRPEAAAGSKTAGPSMEHGTARAMGAPPTCPARQPPGPRARCCHSVTRSRRVVARRPWAGTASSCFARR